ncbi:TPA: cell division protein FtsK, partial [Staphylococcus aureus]
FAFIFLAYRILMLWQGYISQQKALKVVEVYQYFKPHFLYLVIGTLVVFIIAKLFAQLVLRFREKDLAEMIETQGFHNRTVIKKTTEYLDIDYKKTEYDYYPTMFYKRRRKTFMIHVK